MGDLSIRGSGNPIIDGTEKPKLKVQPEIKEKPEDKTDPNTDSVVNLNPSITRSPETDVEGEYKLELEESDSFLSESSSERFQGVHTNRTIELPLFETTRGDFYFNNPFFAEEISGTDDPDYTFHIGAPNYHSAFGTTTSVLFMNSLAKEGLLTLNESLFPTINLPASEVGGVFSGGNAWRSLARGAMLFTYNSVSGSTRIAGHEVGHFNYGSNPGEHIKFDLGFRPDTFHFGINSGVAGSDPVTKTSSFTGGFNQSTYSGTEINRRLHTRGNGTVYDGLDYMQSMIDAPKYMMFDQGDSSVYLDNMESFGWNRTGLKVFSALPLLNPDFLYTGYSIGKYGIAGGSPDLNLPEFNFGNVHMSMPHIGVYHTQEGPMPELSVFLHNEGKETLEMSMGTIVSPDFSPMPAFSFSTTLHNFSIPGLNDQLIISPTVGVSYFDYDSSIDPNAEYSGDKVGFSAGTKLEARPFKEGFMSKFSIIGDMQYSSENYMQNLGVPGNDFRGTFLLGFTPQRE